MIRFNCPACSKTLALKDDNLAGKTIQCPACKAKIKVPGTPAKAAAAKGGPPAKPGAHPDDDFTPYGVQHDEGPNRDAEEEHLDEMVQHAEKMRKRERAWGQVGVPARLMKTMGLIACITWIVAFLWIAITVILYEHQLKIQAQSNKLSGKNEAPTKLIPLGDLMEATGLSHGGVAGVSFGVTAFLVLWYGTIIAAAERMKKLEGYGLAMTGAIMTCVGMPPVGFLALMSLRNPEVIREFEQSAKRSKRAAKAI